MSSQPDPKRRHAACRAETCSRPQSCLQLSKLCSSPAGPRWSESKLGSAARAEMGPHAPLVSYRAWESKVLGSRLRHGWRWLTPQTQPTMELPRRPHQHQRRLLLSGTPASWFHDGFQAAFKFSDFSAGRHKLVRTKIRPEPPLVFNAWGTLVAWNLTTQSPRACVTPLLVASTAPEHLHNSISNPSQPLS